MIFPFPKVAVRVRPLNGSEVEDKSCTEIVHVLDENVSLWKLEARTKFIILVNSVAMRLHFHFKSYIIREKRVGSVIFPWQLCFVLLEFVACIEACFNGPAFCVDSD